MLDKVKSRSKNETKERKPLESKLVSITAPNIAHAQVTIEGTAPYM